MGLKKFTAGVLLASFAALGGLPTNAQTVSPAPASPVAGSPSAQLHANKLHLAYVMSPSQAVNSEARSGLNGLVAELGSKTSVVPAGVVGLNIERDEIALYPFIYWPVSSASPRLSENAQRKVQNYINAGGLIVFDTGYASGNGTGALTRMLGNVILKPLVPMGKNHTLTKTFYLVSDLTGMRNGTVYVEAPGARGTDNVSSVLIGEKMWARAWLELGTESYGDEEKDRVSRAAINMVMYALTGSYKEDQIHIPSILERLDR